MGPICRHGTRVRRADEEYQRYRKSSDREKGVDGASFWSTEPLSRRSTARAFWRVQTSGNAFGKSQGLVGQRW